MSKELRPFALSLAQCEQDLGAFKALLDGKDELSEGNDILPFFRAHPHLAAMIGSSGQRLDQIDRACEELDLFGNFRCDWAAGYWHGRSYTLVEFEDARRNSVFAVGGKYTEDWGRRFEHGFSQLVDWFYAVDMYRDNPDFRQRFGGGPVRFSGVLVAGRRHFLTPSQVERLAWRRDRVTINTNQINFFTFDDLYDDLSGRLLFVRRIADHGDLS
jgi:hypothetical protein